MSLNWPKAGPNFVPAYQVSGIPYVTSSISVELRPVSTNNNQVSEVVKVSFPNVTKSLTITNTGANFIRLGFSENGLFQGGETYSLGNQVGKTGAPYLQRTGGASGNFFLIQSTGSANIHQQASLHNTYTFDIRCKEIYLVSHTTVNDASNPVTHTDHDDKSTSFSLQASLTTINASEFPVLTGSNGWIGVG